MDIVGKLSPNVRGKGRVVIMMRATLGVGQPQSLAISIRDASSDETIPIFVH